MPLAKSSPDIKASDISTATIVNPSESYSRLDVGGVPIDIFSVFNVPLSAGEKEVAKLKTIYDWAKSSESMGDTLIKIRNLENHLGSPDGLNKRYQKVWEYCKMDLYSQELEKKKEALRRRF